MNIALLEIRVPLSGYDYTFLWLQHRAFLNEISRMQVPRVPLLCRLENEQFFLHKASGDGGRLGENKGAV